jgi:hypothetical protein
VYAAAAAGLRALTRRAVVAEGLRLSGGSYERLLDTLGVAPEEHLKFMDFLRHHQLRPEWPGREKERSPLPRVHP